MSIKGLFHSATLAMFCYECKQHIASLRIQTRPMEQKKSANKVLAENLAEYVAAKGGADPDKASQMAFAKKVGVSQRTISYYLHPENRAISKTGKIPSARIGEVETIADALGLETYELLMPKDVREQFKAFQELARKLATPSASTRHPSGKPQKAA